MRIHFLSQLSSEDREIFQRVISETIGTEAASHFIVSSGGASDDSGGADLDEPGHIDVLVAGRPDAELLDRHPELRHLIVPWVGPPGRTIEYVLQRPHIQLYNIHHNAVPVAEMALALLLAGARNIPRRDKLMRQGLWVDSAGDHPSSLILRGKTACILGRGAITAELEPVLRALGMDLRFVRRNPGKNNEEYGPQDKLTAISGSHVLINTLPLTEETVGFIGSEELAQLASGAIVVNVGRGKVFDEQGLFDALNSGRLQSAGIDVWYNYPREDGGRSGIQFPGEQAFHSLDNVVMSPHIGGEWPNPEVQQLRIRHVAQLIANIFNGTAVPLDPNRGY